MFISAAIRADPAEPSGQLLPPPDLDLEIKLKTAGAQNRWRVECAKSLPATASSDSEIQSTPAAFWGCAMNNEPAGALALMLRKLKLWAPLDQADQQALLALPHSIVSIRKRQAVVSEGDAVTHCWVLLSGYCVRYKIVGDGGRQILSIHMMGDLVDLQNALLGVADHGVQALTDCQMAKIPIESIRQLSIARPTINDALWYDTLVDGSIHREWVANVGRRDGRTRIAHLLCEFALKLEAVSLGEQLDYELPMTQEQLANATGMTPVHVNRVLQGLAKDGLIARATSKSVVIGDWKKLAAAGDFNRAYLHLDAAKRKEKSS